MSIEENILMACKSLIDRNKTVVAYTGMLQAMDTTNNIATVAIDGSQTGIPCTPLDDTNIVVGRRVVIIKAGGLFYVVGSLGNRVVNFPSYNGSHPSATNPGDAWYRTDLNHAYMNVNGTPTQLL